MKNFVLSISSIISTQYSKTPTTTIQSIHHIGKQGTYCRDDTYLRCFQFLNYECRPTLCLTVLVLLTPHSSDACKLWYILPMFCNSLTQGHLSEWLRRKTRNLLRNSCVGSSPAVVDHFFFHFCFVACGGRIFHLSSSSQYYTVLLLFIAVHICTVCVYKNSTWARVRKTAAAGRAHVSKTTIF